MKKRIWIPASDENVNLISTALKAAGFNLIKRCDTASGEIWHLFIDSSLEFDGTFAKFILYPDFSICSVSGIVRVLDLMSIQQILFDCYEKIIDCDDQSEE